MLLLNSVQVGTAFAPEIHRAVPLAPGVLRASNVLSLALVRGDGEPLGVVASVLFRAPDAPRAALCPAFAALPSGAAWETLPAETLPPPEFPAGAYHAPCLHNGSRCDSVCAWRGLVPLPCEPRPLPPPPGPPARPWEAYLRAPAPPGLGLEVLVILRDGVRAPALPALPALRRALASLARSAAFPLEAVTVVDWAARPRLDAAARAALGPGVGVLLAPPGADRAAAAGAAAGRARAAWLLVLDETWEFPAAGLWLHEAIGVLRARPAAPAVAVAAGEHPLPRMRAAVERSGHVAFPLAPSWRAGASGLSLARPTLYRAAALRELAGPPGELCGDEQLDERARAGGYAVAALARGWAQQQAGA